MQSYYSYILLSSKHHIFYYGSTNNLQRRVREHNEGKIVATRNKGPWKLVWYGVFSSEKDARAFEAYLKTGSGKAFAYKRLIKEALEKDFKKGRIPRSSEA